ncbi:MAG: hypothetical protein WBW80_15155 [Acidimicrobiales bacterium]
MSEPRLPARVFLDDTSAPMRSQALNNDFHRWPSLGLTCFLEGGQERLPFFAFLFASLGFLVVPLSDLRQYFVEAH